MLDAWKRTALRSQLFYHTENVVTFSCNLGRAPIVVRLRSAWVPSHAPFYFSSSFKNHPLQKNSRISPCLGILLFNVNVLFQNKFEKMSVVKAHGIAMFSLRIIRVLVNILQLLCLHNSQRFVDFIETPAWARRMRGFLFEEIANANKWRQRAYWGGGVVVVAPMCKPRECRATVNR